MNEAEAELPPLEHVKAEVAAIKAADALRPNHNPAQLHADEDGLYLYVLRKTAEGHPDAPAMAQEALKLDELEFSRWYA